MTVGSGGAGGGLRLGEMRRASRWTLGFLQKLRELLLLSDWRPGNVEAFLYSYKYRLKSMQYFNNSTIKGARVLAPQPGHSTRFPTVGAHSRLTHAARSPWRHTSR